MRVHGTHELGHTLGLAVGAAAIHSRGPTGVFLWHMSQVWRLIAVDGSGTGQEKSTDAGRFCEFEHAASPVDVAVESAERVLRGGVAVRLGGGVDDVGEIAAGK